MLLMANYFKHIKVSCNDGYEFLSLLKEPVCSSQTLQRAVGVVISSLQMGRLVEVKDGAGDQWYSQGCCELLRFTATCHPSYLLGEHRGKWCVN